MLRRLLTLILLVPLSLNGLWVECAEAEPAPSASTEASALTDEAAAIRPICKGEPMCPLHKPAAAVETLDEQSGEQAIVAESSAPETGAICLISPDGSRTSIAAIGFLYAPPIAAAEIAAPQADPVKISGATELFYLDSLLPGDTPPPRA